MNEVKIKRAIEFECLLHNKKALLSRWRSCRKPAQKQLQQQSRQQFEQLLQESILKVDRRRGLRPAINLNQSLPFYEFRNELSQTIAANQVTIVCGETGSGKTTQLPQIAIDLGLADRGLIGHTQPRRLAARAVASRIAEELAMPEAVGYKVRFTDTTQPKAYVKLMTDGILLAEIQQDRYLNAYQTLIIDEAHERSLNIDLLLGYLKQLLPKRPDLKLIITSATIDPQRFSDYFDQAPIVMVSGRTFPVELRYRPVQDEEERDRDLNAALLDALDELFQHSPEDTLVFFPGEQQIREAAERIKKRFHQCLVLPLYARLNQQQQQQIFKRAAQPKIILSTNVAETSLTVPGIRYVIDTGLARMSRYSWRAKVQRLPIEKISQASANQRSGRCGRVAPGVCIRLYDEEDFKLRPEFTEPEILRTNLAAVILQMDNLRVGHIHDFDFIDSPDKRLIRDGYRLLNELQAVKTNDQVTRLGKQISRFPIDPRLSRMLIKANEQGCLREVLIIVSLLSIQDPRDTSQENRQQANQLFALWRDKQSDFIGWINLWHEIKKQKKSLSQNQFNKWCKKSYLSWIRIREWQDIYQQIKDQLSELKMTLNNQDADAESIHRCILVGIPSHIAHFDQDREYASTRGRKTSIFPDSVLSNKTPKWIMAFSLIETTRLYAHVVAPINPQWIMKELPHLHQYEYLEPHWQQRQGRVAALRTTRVYGLPVETGKRVNFAAVDAKTSRAIFIREALVDGRYDTRIDFIQHNRKLVERYREAEARQRRRDILISDDQLFDFYDQRLPQQCVDGVAFESWAKSLDAATIQSLTLFDTDVTQDAADVNEQDFPKTLTVRNQTLPLEYVFDPSDEADGVTVLIPLPLLNQFQAQDFEYLVPGFLEEKIEQLIRNLPKRLRKHFIPVPEFAHACLQSIDRQKPLLPQMTRQLQRMTGVSLEEADWCTDTLIAHLMMRFCVVESSARKACSRDLLELQQQYAAQANSAFQQQVQHEDHLAREQLSSWDFDHLPESTQLLRNGMHINVFPALVDYQEYVNIELFETSQEAQFYHPTGVTRLFMLNLKQEVRYAKKTVSQSPQMGLLYHPFGSLSELQDDIVKAATRGCFLANGLPQNRLQFEATFEQHKNEFQSRVNEVTEQVAKALQAYRSVRQQLKQAGLPKAHKQDIENQLAYLFYPGFVDLTGVKQLSRLPHYLLALQKRIEKTAQNAASADRALASLDPLWNQYLSLDEQACSTEQLDRLHWLFEEWRIGLFAQPMKPGVPVSEKKIKQALEACL